MVMVLPAARVGVRRRTLLGALVVFVAALVFVSVAYLVVTAHQVKVIWGIPASVTTVPLTVTTEGGT